MKKLAKTFLLGIACMLASCGGATGNGGGSSTTGGGGNGGQPSSGAYVTELKTDWAALVEGSTAYDDWCAEKYYYDVKFDKDAKCTAYDTVYQLRAGSDWEIVNERLESGNYKPVWNSDKTSFSNSRSHNYTKIDSVREGWNEDYYSYTVFYSDGTSTRVEEPTQAQKDADLLKNLGITKDILVQSGTRNPSYHNQKQYQIGAYLECDDLDLTKINAYGASLYNAIKQIADGGIMYDYIEYTPIDTCPQITNVFSSVMFMYKFNGVKINVSTSIYDDYSGGPKKISVAVAKSAWN